MSNTIECPFCKNDINEGAEVCTGCNAMKAAYADEKWVLSREEAELLAEDYLKKSKIGWTIVVALIVLTFGYAIFSDEPLSAITWGVVALVASLIAGMFSTGYFKLKKALSEPDQWFRKS